MRGNYQFAILSSLLCCFLVWLVALLLSLGNPQSPCPLRPSSWLKPTAISTLARSPSCENSLKGKRPAELESTENVVLTFTGGIPRSAKSCLIRALPICGVLCPTLVGSATMERDQIGLVRSPRSSHRQAQVPIGMFTHLCFVLGGAVITISSNLLGPLMGITSVLWLMMRNDSAIDPRVAWMMFAAWFFFGLTYFMVQCNRVCNHRLYIFLSLGLASSSLCIFALLQRSSLQNGLVTVIPPCMSFAAYAVAYFFPDRIQEKLVHEV